MQHIESKSPNVVRCFSRRLRERPLLEIYDLRDRSGVADPPIRLYREAGYDV
jgi:hypothetical protein